MKNVKEIFKSYSVYLGIMFLSVSLVGCSSDDDALEPDPDPTGSITATDQTLTGNTIMVQSVTVGQTSWLVAVHAGDENTDDFITDPERMNEGMNSDIELTLNEDANLSTGETGNEISLKLYEDNPNEGTQGEWDPFDEPIFDDNDVLAIETITVFVEDDATAAFNEFDTNADGTLDRDEVAGTYVNDFATWDADGDGSLNEDEFFNTTFGNTDVDDDEFINEDEWNAGYTGMYGNYAGDTDFATWDADADGNLDYDEWNTGFAESPWFTTYDADSDATITEDEWNEGLYTDWDADNDDTINLEEYGAYSPYTTAW